MNRSRYRLLASGLVLSMVVTASAAEPGWKLPNLNFFSKKNSDTSTNRHTHKKSTGLAFPKINLWPSQRRATGSRSGQPSTWSRLNRGTKTFFKKTKEALAAPWIAASEKSKSSHRNSARRHSSVSRKHPEKKKSFFASWFQEEEPKKPQTITDFLNQPRPGF